MHEYVVPWSEDDVDGVDVAEDEADHDFGGHAEVHVEVVHSLCEYWLSSCFADDVVEELAYEVAVEISGLGVFYCFSCKAHRTIGVRRYLLHVARAKLKELCEIYTWGTLMTKQCTHSKVWSGLFHEEPVDEISTFVEISARGHGLGLGFKQRVAEVFIGGIVNILICVEMQEDAIGEE